MFLASHCNPCVFSGEASFLTRQLELKSGLLMKARLVSDAPACFCCHGADFDVLLICSQAMKMNFVKSGDSRSSSCWCPGEKHSSRLVGI